MPAPTPGNATVLLKCRQRTVKPKAYEQEWGPFWVHGAETTWDPWAGIGARRGAEHSELS